MTAVGFKINEMLAFMVFEVYRICLFSYEIIVMFICRSKMDRAIYYIYIYLFIYHTYLEKYHFE